VEWTASGTMFCNPSPTLNEQSLPPADTTRAGFCEKKKERLIKYRHTPKYRKTSNKRRVLDIGRTHLAIQSCQSTSHTLVTSATPILSDDIDNSLFLANQVDINAEN